MISPTPINLVKIKDLSEFYDCYVEDATDLLFQDCVYLEEGETFKESVLIKRLLSDSGSEFDGIDSYMDKLSLVYSSQYEGYDLTESSKGILGKEFAKYGEHSIDFVIESRSSLNSETTLTLKYCALSGGCSPNSETTLTYIEPESETLVTSDIDNFVLPTTPDLLDASNVSNYTCIGPFSEDYQLSTKVIIGCTPQGKYALFKAI